MIRLEAGPEITDATAGGRTECVMLNRGTHLALAVRIPGRIISRMQANQSQRGHGPQPS